MGDVVFFNAGSLIENVTVVNVFNKFDVDEYKRNYILQPWATWRNNNDLTDESEEDSSNRTYHSDDSITENNDSDCFLYNKTLSIKHTEEVTAFIISNGSTVRDYKEHYNLSIGLYVQEFAVDAAALDLIVNHVNRNVNVYNLGLGWGGLNGVVVNGIEPGRFTLTDGFWNQRYGSKNWNSLLYPCKSIEKMKV